MKIDSNELIKMLDFAIFQEEQDKEPEMGTQKHQAFIAGLHNARDLVKAFIAKKELLG